MEPSKSISVKSSHSETGPKWFSSSFFEITTDSTIFLIRERTIL